jgi:hypothetical protein
MTLLNGVSLEVLRAEMRKRFVDCERRLGKLEGVKNEGEPDKWGGEGEERGDDGHNSLIPSDPEALLTRRTAADTLTAAGFPVRPATLATFASRGRGPAYRLFGKRPLYRWGDALQWAKSRLSTPRSNSSEGDAACGEPDKADEGNNRQNGGGAPVIARRKRLFGTTDDDEADPVSHHRREGKGRRSMTGEGA